MLIIIDDIQYYTILQKSNQRELEGIWQFNKGTFSVCFTLGDRIFLPNPSYQTLVLFCPIIVMPFCSPFPLHIASLKQNHTTYHLQLSFWNSIQLKTTHFTDRAIKRNRPTTQILWYANYFVHVKAELLFFTSKI